MTGGVHAGKLPWQHGEADVNIRQPTEEDIAEAKARALGMKMSRMQMEAAQKRAERNARSVSPYTHGTTSGGATSKHDRQMAEYRKSQACFARCAVTGQRPPITRGLHDGSTYRIPGGTYRDVSACGHCNNVKKP